MDGGGRGWGRRGEKGGELGGEGNGVLGNEGRKRAVVALLDVREWGPGGVPGEEGVEWPWAWGTRDPGGLGSSRLPPDHELLLCPEGSGLPGNRPGVGCPGVADTIQPFLQVPVGVLPNILLVLQEVVVGGVEGVLASGKLLGDPPKEVGSVAFVLGREGPVLDVVSVLPHLPSH